MAREEFPKNIRKALAAQAGNRCSFPECDIPTSGPSAEAIDATSNTGNAAHIWAASGGPGARRVHPNPPPGFLSSIENGIWCCATHATLIDNDEIAYSVALLQHWKTLAMERAAIRQKGGALNREILITFGMAPEEIEPPAAEGDDNEAIGLAVRNSWLADIVGRDLADAVRDFVCEYSRNARQHAGATNVKVEFSGRCVVISDDGSEFNYQTLRNSNVGRGGAHAFNALCGELAPVDPIFYRTIGGRNVCTIPFVSRGDELVGLNPCVIEITRPHEESVVLRDKLMRLTGCQKVYIVIPRFASQSDSIHFVDPITAAEANGQQVVLLTQSSKHVNAYFQSIFPKAILQKF